MSAYRKASDTTFFRSHDMVTLLALSDWRWEASKYTDGNLGLLLIFSSIFRRYGSAFACPIRHMSPR